MRRVIKKPLRIEEQELSFVVLRRRGGGVAGREKGDGSEELDEEEGVVEVAMDEELGVDLVDVGKGDRAEG